MTAKFPKQTQDIIDRLAAVSFDGFVLDRGKVYQALAMHLQRLELAPMPIRWCDDAVIGLKAAESAAWSAAWSAARSAAWSAAWSAAESAARSAAESAAELDKIERYVGIWLPFLDAFEAGLWLYWIIGKEILAVPRPVMLMRGQQLHCEDGPAVWWPNGTQYFFLHNVRMKKEYIITPAEQLNPYCILDETNAERRRELLRKIGIERFLGVIDANTLDQVGDYELLQLPFNGIDMTYLKMRNPSIGVWHLEGVHPSCKTVHEALNWRSTGKKEEAWRPSVLT